MTHRYPKPEWQAVWECPLCGSQLAIGDKASATNVTTTPPRCTIGHSRREMEQKLSEAMPIPPTT